MENKNKLALNWKAEIIESFINSNSFNSLEILFES